MVQLGAHLSIAKGLPKAASLAQSIGAETFGYFTRNPRGGAARAIEAKEIEAWEAAKAEAGLGPTLGHMPYTVNLAARDPKVHDFATMVLREDLRRVAAFGGEYMVVHPGSHQGDGVQAGIARIVATLQDALVQDDGPTMLLLESMAGSGSEVGFTFAQLRQIMDGAGNPGNLGVCLDSCHLFGAGVDWKDKKAIEALLEEIDREVGLGRVRAMHLNDSKKPLGSHKDRHEKVGEGLIGREGLMNILTDPFLSTLPLVLETPVEDVEEYGEELKKLRAWLAEG